MKALRDRGYHTLTAGQLTEMVGEGCWPDAKTVVLTFDDGFENFLTHAFPVLQEHSFTATVYLVTSQCGRFNDWAGNPTELPRSRLLSWEQVNELSAHGIEFGSHTVSHPDLTRLDARAADVEICDSKAAIEDSVGKKVASFAYPFGRINATVKQSVRSNYSSACSTNLGKITHRSDFYSLERIDAYYLSDSRSLELIDTPWMDAYLGVRQALRRVKSAVARN